MPVDALAQVDVFLEYGLGLAFMGGIMGYMFWWIFKEFIWGA